MATQIKLRRDSYQNWYDNNPVLAQGEPGWDLTNKKLKIGDGATLWRVLPYFDDQVGDRLVNGVNEIVLDATGALAYPNTAVQRDTGVINCAGNASTMIYTTSSASNQHTIKLLIQVEGTVGAAVDMDTQACEMIIAKSFRADAIAASVYGVVHTSAAPLATFTADWNVLTSKVEVLCTTPSANGVSVKIFATEITTSD
jgi:hypothetical protein